MDPLIFILALPIGILAGLGAGLVGLTAWPLLVPLLLLAGGYSPQDAILTSLVIDLVNALVVTTFYEKRGAVKPEIRRSLQMGLVAVVPAAVVALAVFPILGSYSDAFKGGSGIINLLLGSLFVIQAFRTNGEDKNENQGSVGAKPERWVFVYGFCIVQGIVTGVIGIGGAMNLVIVLLIATSLRTRAAVGTAMAATAVLLGGTISVYLVMFSFTVSTLDVIVLVSAIASVSCVLGLLRSSRISEKYLRLAIGAVVLTAAVLSILQVAVLE